MKLVKKTADYSIFQRGDERYAVKDVYKQPINGEDKVRILTTEGLVKVTAPKAPAPEEEPAAEEEVVAEESSAAEEAPAEEAAEAEGEGEK
ncbi:hypothetical protein [Kineobactrum salinum]|uniref:Uncharacterized protein n=1 Tax=Kineobactrum salinum TaxID=2708301 RepID=A0A6C0U6A7_9GAMM|nr:hypothetical protein G3T16_17070 [Kineobactrum salinum]